MSDTPSTIQRAPSEWMEAAHLLRPQGRRGELLADPAAEFDLFVPGRQLALARDPHAPSLPLALLELEAAWQPTGRNAGRLVLKLRGTDTITAAESLAGQYLLLRTADLPPLAEGTYRVRDLVGCTLYDGDLPVGTVNDLQFPVAPDGRTRLEDAPDLLVVTPTSAAMDTPDAGDTLPAPEQVLVPFVRAWLRELDLPGKRLYMQLPQGLFGEEE